MFDFVLLEISQHFLNGSQVELGSFGARVTGGYGWYCTLKVQCVVKWPELKLSTECEDYIKDLHVR